MKELTQDQTPDPANAHEQSNDMLRTQALGSSRDRSLPMIIIKPSVFWLAVPEDIARVHQNQYGKDDINREADDDGEFEKYG
jgi:hypothetical protein